MHLETLEKSWKMVRSLEKRWALSIQPILSYRGVETMQLLK